MLRKTLALNPLFLTLQGLCGQQPFSKNYQTNEGLPSNYIYSVFQDAQGYIWTSPNVGVSRFDGQSFVHYNTAQGMPDNQVFSLCEDHAGRIWFATLNGKPGFFNHGKIYTKQDLDFLKRCDLRGLSIKLFEQEDGRMVYCGVFKSILSQSPPAPPALGQLIWEEKTSSSLLNFDLSDRISGCYYLRVQSGREVSVLKLMLVR
jgi:ligand-binding sensor domain-containing protein